MVDYTEMGFELSPSPFADEHSVTDQMLRDVRTRTLNTVDPAWERHALMKLAQSRGWLSQHQRFEIGRSDLPRNELAQMYGVSADYVTQLKSRYKRGEL
jgi:hypothetical protein